MQALFLIVASIILSIASVTSLILLITKDNKIFKYLFILVSFMASCLSFAIGAKIGKEIEGSIISANGSVIFAPQFCSQLKKMVDSGDQKLINEYLSDLESTPEIFFFADEYLHYSEDFINKWDEKLKDNSLD